jgi:hypothetical protein
MPGVPKLVTEFLDDVPSKKLESLSIRSSNLHRDEDFHLSLSAVSIHLYPLNQLDNLIVTVESKNHIRPTKSDHSQSDNQ